MTRYELACWQWLRRALRDELGIPCERVGRRQRLTDAEARATAVIVESRPSGERERTIDIIAERLHVGRSTIKRALERYGSRPARMRRASSTVRAIPARPPSDLQTSR